MSRIYIYKTVEVEETVEDMLKRYNIASNDKVAKIKLLLSLMKEYMVGVVLKACIFLLLTIFYIGLQGKSL